MPATFRYSLLMFIGLVLLFAGCSEKKEGVLSNRNLTLLEQCLVGKWKWVYYQERDSVCFGSDLSFAGVKDNAPYHGYFSAAADSVLRLNGWFFIGGLWTEQIYQYRVLEVDNARLRLEVNGAVVFYDRVF